MNIKEKLTVIKDKMIEWKATIFKNTKERLCIIFEKIKVVFGKFLTWIKPFLDIVWEIIKEPVKALWDAIYNFIGATIVLVLTTCSVIVWIIINIGLTISFKLEERKANKE